MATPGQPTAAPERPGSGPAGNGASERPVNPTAFVNRQRVPLTVDKFGQTGVALESKLVKSRAEAVRASTSGCRTSTRA